MAVKRRKVGVRRRTCSEALAVWVANGEIADGDAETFLTVPAPLAHDAEEQLRRLWLNAGGANAISWAAFWRREKWRVRSDGS